MESSDKTGAIRVVLIGASGYAGFEAIRLLLRHPHVRITGMFGPQNELGPIQGFFPLLSKQIEMNQELFDPATAAKLGDVALLCVPHKVAMSYVPKLRAAGLKVIDWSADYRLTDPDVYAQWYSHEHTDATGLAEAVYGLPEYFAPRIAEASLVANPGCYPTCAALALAPLLTEKLIVDDDIVVNAISGISGAGRRHSRAQHFPERNENFEPYGVGTHRHMPEIEQTLSAMTGRDIQLLFVPHMSPMDRGMLCSTYARPARDNLTAETCAEALLAAYKDAPFVRVRTDILPATKYVTHTNFCDVAVRVAKGRVIVFSAIDNLVKGASGQAIQNLNIMSGWDQKTGLI